MRVNDETRPWMRCLCLTRGKDAGKLVARVKWCMQGVREVVKECQCLLSVVASAADVAFCLPSLYPLLW